MSAPGSRIGPYAIVAPLGVGGMGEVYRATDSRLKRQVAIKILPAALATDPDRLARFQREAEVLASLNHPHIAAVYGLEDVQATGGGLAGKALVMELVEGPTLADRIAQGPLPVNEALAIAKQIAAALEAAHEQGIVHRDLKPANIKVRDDGTVKVLDFGLAKLADTGAARGTQIDLSNSPTITAPANTGMGVILGTAAYMSPEQARGRAVDKRTDVWAFGAVLYEMLTGARAFDGEDVTEMMASVMKSMPNWAAIHSDVPPHVVTLIQRCLEKDRNARIGDIAVARFLLSDHATVGAASAVAAHGASAPAAASASRWRAPRWRVVILLVVAAVLINDSLSDWIRSRGATNVAPVARLQMSVSPADQLMGSRVSGSFRPVHTAIAVSPDGRRVVFAGALKGAPQLFSRDIDRGEATPMPGTEGGDAPFFSPDGAWVGFWARNTLKKVPAGGGPAATISDIPPGLGWGASWGEDDTIFFARDTGIFKVSASGGAPVAVTTSNDERHLLPHALPGGNAIIYTRTTVEEQSGRRWDKASIVLHPLGGEEQRVLISGGTDARYVSTGHLVYMNSGTLMAVPFDARSQQVTGAPIALIEGVMQSVNTPNTDDETGAGQFAVSDSGTLLYVTGGISPMMKARLAWADRKGVSAPIASVPEGSYSNPHLSPDGQKIVVAAKGGIGENSDLWVHDVVRGAPTRLTFDGADVPSWSPDGKRLVYTRDTLHTISADGSGKPEPVLSIGEHPVPTSWVGDMIVFVRKTQSGANGIWVLPSAGGATPKLFLESRFGLWHPDLSPDGGWMAYVSLESGFSEVYVQPYPGPGEKIRISTDGGFDPLWTRSGGEILYRSHASGASQHFLSATIRSLAPFRADPPRVLFEAKFLEFDSTMPERSWDISADGQRFLLLKGVGSSDRPIASMHIVLNWAQELERLVQAK